MMTANTFNVQIQSLDLIEQKGKNSNKAISDLRDEVINMTNELYHLSNESKKERMFGLYTTIDSEGLLKIINSQSSYTSKLVTSLSKISTIANENIVDINSMMRILLNISQSIYSDIVSNTKTVDEVYKEINSSKSSTLTQNSQFKELIEITVNRAQNDKVRFDELERKVKKLEKSENAFYKKLRSRVDNLEQRVAEVINAINNNSTYDNDFEERLLKLEENEIVEIAEDNNLDEDEQSTEVITRLINLENLASNKTNTMTIIGGIIFIAAIVVIFGVVIIIKM